jgi:hypothetical protein
MSFAYYKVFTNSKYSLYGLFRNFRLHKIHRNQLKKKDSALPAVPIEFCGLTSLIFLQYLTLQLLLLQQLLFSCLIDNRLPFQPILAFYWRFCNLLYSKDFKASNAFNACSFLTLLLFVECFCSLAKFYEILSCSVGRLVPVVLLHSLNQSSLLFISSNCLLGNL